MIINVGIIIGSAIGVFVIFFCTPLTVCIITIAVVVVIAKGRRRREAERKDVVSTGYQTEPGIIDPSDISPPPLELEPVQELTVDTDTLLSSNNAVPQ